MKSILIILSALFTISTFAVEDDRLVLVHAVMSTCFEPQARERERQLL